MLVTDVLSTIMVMAEAANRGWLAGWMDVLGWYTSISTTTISVTALQGHSLSTKIFVLLFVGAANLLGTKLGQLTGHWILTRKSAHAPRETVALAAQRVVSRDKGLEP